VDRVVATEKEGWWLPTFARASQNWATVAALLYTLPEPSTGVVIEVYQQIKNIVGTTTP
jgi:hypothetical protein